MKKAPEQHRTTALVLTVVTIVVTVVVAVVLAKRTVIADVGMAQEGFVMVAKAVAHKLVEALVDSMAATKEERMTAADAERTMTVGKSWVTGVMEMCLEMVMQKTIKRLVQKVTAVLGEMIVEQITVASAVLPVVAAVVAMALRFVKEPVQEEAIMMVLCSIAEERKKRANEKGASFWAFFVGLFRAQSKETVGNKSLVQNSEDSREDRWKGEAYPSMQAYPSPLPRGSHCAPVLGIPLLPLKWSLETIHFLAFVFIDESLEKSRKESGDHYQCYHPENHP
ncbi:uncharacterized protein LOC119870993 isoform X8 [Canis lupus familiaris]|uniref:uncharacterized protein LOC119870993 isoform X8 n=1 Tax=Canis lupus familiaris TaxID=9615 RepID=UPI0018F62278|nr:uncharacterized protein LOC119870993 isoform X8 [Canis lupus familiaris]